MTYTTETLLAELRQYCCCRFHPNVNDTSRSIVELFDLDSLQEVEWLISLEYWANRRLPDAFVSTWSIDQAVCFLNGQPPS